MRRPIKNLAPRSAPVLIIEDLPDHAFLLHRELRKAGVLNPVRVIDSGSEAIKYMSGTGLYEERATFPLPSVILLDLKLKGQTQGFDVLQWLRSRHEYDSILVIVLSELERSDIIRQAYEMGANSYLIKPATREELENTLAGFKGYWLLKHELVQEAATEREVTSNE